jgi:PBP1b-binding outer membrane lipoprotein LpoB
VRRGAVAALAAALAIALGACADKATQAPAEPEPEAAAEEATQAARLVAVYPIEPAPPPRSGGIVAPPPGPEAGVAVSAQVYRALADQTEFRFVPDLTVQDEVQTPEVRRAGDLLERVLALGKQVGADAVIFGRVFRFQKRVGTQYGATQPASVWFELAVADVASGEVVWHDEFDETQQPLSSNLLNWWMFWRAGPRWMSAGELAALGVDRMFGAITSAIEREG